ncbi:PH domain-containing protein [Parvularcula flava]|uniref:PH domain-containing protein n=1 Tax=Aquisalinus luteolus TaxID=1566827 RepID=A0A8J3EQ75_9PROT|nr:PH domain-containing protein [Aquisalinus luteolus]NHK29299.1 PH domain-containing protein [Aquisalinus luteolus]GGI01200.1 hypothetical protein GCM10011355_31280 [Aquisalinus luteolus]
MTSYVRQSLTHEEQLLAEGNFPWPYHALSWIALFTLGWFLIGIYIWARMQIHFSVTEVGVTSQRVLIKRGLFNKRTMELGLASVEQVEVRQSLIGQIFNFGTLEMHGSGEGEITTPPIARPVAFRRVLSEAIAHARNPKVRIDHDDEFTVPPGAGVEGQSANTHFNVPLGPHTRQASRPSPRPAAGHKPLIATRTAPPAR